MIKRITFVATLLLFILTTMAQEKKSFTLDELLSGGNKFWSLRPETMNASWWGNRLVERNVESCNEINVKTGKRSALISLAKVNKILSVRDLKLHTLQSVRFPYASRSIISFDTKGKRVLVDFKKGEIVSVLELGMKSSHNDWCSASNSEAFVEDDNLYVVTNDGVKHQISSDGSREIVYGQSVHRDEFGIYKGTFWSPKGSLLAFYRMDQSMVTDYPQVDISARVAKCVPDKYPMAGMTSHKVTVGVFNPSNGKTIYLDAGDPTDRYFTNISWSPDEKTVYVIELNRDQNHAELVSYDAMTGKRGSVIYEERHAKYVHPKHGITFLPWDSSKFIYQSEKDGYNHLYLFDAEGKELKQITKGSFVVLDVLGFNMVEKSVIIKSTEASPIQNNFYSVNIATGKRSLLDSGDGVHNGTLSVNGEYVLDTYSSPKVVKSINVLSTSKVSHRNLVTSKDPYEAYATPEITCGTIKAADGATDLYYRLIKPVDFDPNKKYPTIVYVYGGPGVRMVEASHNFGSRGWELYMAQKGYLLFVLDSRGSKDRGLAFENVTFRHLGDEEMKDQIRGVDFLKSLPYVDSERMGVHGWSFGGFMTTNLMVSYPGVFKCAVAGGPVIDWEYYEVMYGERYMDTPQANPEGYKGSNLRLKAGNLKGRLELIHGYNDPVCVPQHTLSFIRAAEDAGTHPDLFLYPGQGHNMAGKDMIHLHEHITRYFEDHLK